MVYQVANREEKRMVVHPQRMSQFRKPGNVYVITCTDEFDGDHSKGCRRGFYSLFIQALQGIFLAQRMSMPYYIDFGNRPYRYVNVHEGDSNFWNNYFIQPHPKPDAELSVINYPNEVYPICIWARSYFETIHDEVVKKLIWRPEVFSYLNRETEIFRKHHVLGVHIRKTDHFNEIAPVALKTYLKKIDQQMNRFDKLFLATDDRDVLQLLQARYGDKLFYHQAHRSEGSTAVHSRDDIDNRHRLGLEALLEGYSLSLCKRAILSPSNLSFAACLFNPQLPHTLLESRPAWRKRMKSLVLYQLDQWNVRKW
ncbi:MAG TPA: hypothetical protein VL728_17990 [Cyclobacteriaceae bacterium]|nr:hypothetical protein [Cyclobacteriaceae bacterium]